VIETTAIERYLDADQAVRLAQALVRIPSVNPPGDEAAVARYLADYVSTAGLDVELVDVLPGRPNLLATARFGSGSPTVLLNGHTDVVVPGDGWVDENPFSGAIRDGRLYGRGSADMKGPLAAMVEAALGIVRSGLLTRGTIVLAAVMGEEYGALGTKALAQRRVTADHAIVGEPSELKPVIAHKGTVRYELRVDGTAAHGSVPERGVNAIYGMSDVVHALRDLHQKLADRPHTLVGPPTINVGTIAGGSGTCIVPDRCSITIDRRVVPGEDVADATGEIEALVDRLRARDPGFRGSLVLQNIAPAMEIAPTQPVVMAIRRAAAEVTGTDPGVHGWTATADSNILVNDLGIPTVIFGPGSIHEVAHKPNEYISIADLKSAVSIYALAILDLLK
jgi:acetylornithine deacetylase/succinyl-diaminopimelate desuccinylase family protein